MIAWVGRAGYRVGKVKKSEDDTIVLENSMHERASCSTVCISQDFSVTTDALSGDSSKESDSSKDKDASKFSPNRKPLLHPTIFQISVKSL